MVFPNSRFNEVILVVVDRPSKYAYLLPLKHPYITQAVAARFIDTVVKFRGGNWVG